MKIINTKKIECFKCGVETDHLISAVLNKRICTQCWTETKARPVDFVEMIVMHSGDRERRV
jgi:hypothetical protein